MSRGGEPAEFDGKRERWWPAGAALGALFGVVLLVDDDASDNGYWRVEADAAAIESAEAETAGPVRLEARAIAPTGQPLAAGGGAPVPVDARSDPPSADREGAAPRSRLADEGAAATPLDYVAEPSFADAASPSEPRYAALAPAARTSDRADATPARVVLDVDAAELEAVLGDDEADAPSQTASVDVQAILQRARERRAAAERLAREAEERFRANAEGDAALADGARGEDAGGAGDGVEDEGTAAASRPSAEPVSDREAAPSAEHAASEPADGPENPLAKVESALANEEAEPARPIEPLSDAETTIAGPEPVAAERLAFEAASPEPGGDASSEPTPAFEDGSLDAIAASEGDAAEAAADRVASALSSRDEPSAPEPSFHQDDGALETTLAERREGTDAPTRQRALVLPEIVVPEEASGPVAARRASTIEPAAGPLEREAADEPPVEASSEGGDASPAAALQVVRGGAAASARTSEPEEIEQAAVDAVSLPRRRASPSRERTFDAPPPAEDAPPLLAIVIDDVGASAATTRRVAALPAPITLAFLPYEHDVARLAADAEELGHEIALHLPMEPIGDQDPGPDALLAEHGDDELRARIDRAFAALPEAKLVNNHMGSRLTQDVGAMGVVMDALIEREASFLDSRTTAATRALEVAQARGVPSLGRDVFLDALQERDFVEKQLLSAVRLARGVGVAIAIGHPHPVTLDVLEEMLPPLLDAGEIALIGAGEAIARWGCDGASEAYVDTCSGPRIASNDR